MSTNIKNANVNWKFKYKIIISSSNCLITTDETRFLRLEKSNKA